jgi:RNA-splicing ligase RtcB
VPAEYAAVGRPVFVPGSMGTASFVARLVPPGVVKG